MDPLIPPILASLPTPSTSASRSTVTFHAPQDEPSHVGTLSAAAPGSSTRATHSFPSHLPPPPSLSPKPAKLARLDLQDDGCMQRAELLMDWMEGMPVEHSVSALVEDTVVPGSWREDGDDMEDVTGYSSDEPMGMATQEVVDLPAGPRIGPEQTKMIARMRHLGAEESMPVLQTVGDVPFGINEQFVDVTGRKCILERTEEDLRVTWIGRMGEALAEIGLDDEWIPDAVRMRKRRRKVKIPELGPRRLAYHFGSLLPYSAGDVFEFTDEDNVQTTRAMTLEQDRILNAQDLPAPIKFIQRLHARFCLINPFESTLERELACWRHYSPILHHHSLRPALITHLQCLLEHNHLTTSTFLQIVRLYDQQVLEIDDPEGTVVGYWEWREKKGLDELIRREREMRGRVDYDPQVETT